MRRAVATARMITAALIALLTVATLAGFLDQLSWVFEPASFFRLQYAGVLAIAAIAGLALGRLRLAGIAAVMASINIAAIAP
jgi:TctA family transporter